MMKQIKIIFFVLIALIMGTFLAGSLYFREINSSYVASMMGIQAKRFLYEIQYALYSAPNAIASVESVFNDPEHYERNREYAYSVPVLMYHGILDEWDGTQTNISLKRFRNHMFALKKAGYQTITLEELYQFKQGNLEVPNKSVVITFDDGRADSFYPADPIFRALDYKAAMFVIGRYGLNPISEYYLTTRALKSMTNSGIWEIGSHSYDGHGADYPIGPDGEKGSFYSNKFWLAQESRFETDTEFFLRVRSDMDASQEQLEREIGVPVIAFAFPFGDFGQEYTNSPDTIIMTAQYALEKHNLVFYQHQPGGYFRQTYPENADQSFLVRRFSVPGDWDADKLLAELQKSRAKLLPYHESFLQDTGWISSWGFVAGRGSQGLTIRPDEGETGASMILDGTRHWENYTLSAFVSSPNRTGVFVWVRFQNDKNNAACNFGKNFVHIEQTVDGEHRVIKGIDNIDPIPSGNFEVSVEVNGRYVACAINGTTIVETDFLDRTLDTGGIGFKAWDRTPNISVLNVYKLTVDPL